MSKYFVFINIRSYYIFIFYETHVFYLIYDTPYELRIIYFLFKFTHDNSYHTLQKNTTTEAIIYTYLSHTRDTLQLFSKY